MGITTDEVLAGLRVVSIPLRVPFRGIGHREVALIEGPAGWGEFGPFLEYGPREASAWLAAALEAAFVGWPEPVRDRVEINATVPAVAATEVPRVLDRFPGCSTAKVKVAQVGQSLADDLRRVAAVRSVLGEKGRVRIDANGGWTRSEATEALSQLAGYDLEYVEQPCATVEDLADLRISLARRHIDLLIAADESIRKAADPRRVRDLGAADLIIVKVAPLGGVRRALAVVEECALPAVVSSALDTSVGMSAGLALAAALPRLDHACGLGTVGLFGGDVVEDSLRPVGGALSPTRVVPHPDLLTRWQAAPERVTWWRERMRRAWAFVDPSSG